MAEKIVELKKIIPVIILNWNGEKDSIACLESIKNCENYRFLPVLVDNGSNFESLRILKSNCLKIFNKIIFLNEDSIESSKDFIKATIYNNQINEILFFIENFKNHGFARGNNIGARIASIIDSDWLMLLNNDTEIISDTFTKLIDFVDNNDDIVAVSPQIRFHEPKDLIWNCGGKLTFFGSRKYFFANQKIELVPDKGFSLITFITGCALLFQYKKTGLLTEDFFFGEEDYEFSLRLKRRNLKMACIFESIVFHKVGSTINKNNNIVNNIYLYYINRLINTRNYYSKLRWELTRMLSLLYLPVLLIKNKINPLKSILLFKNVNKYIKNNNKVDSNEFYRITRYKL
jgi:GT2 family glycosyltransferase